MLLFSTAPRDDTICHHIVYKWIISSASYAVYYHLYHINSHILSLIFTLKCLYIYIIIILCYTYDHQYHIIISISSSYISISSSLIGILCIFSCIEELVHYMGKLMSDYICILSSFGCELCVCCDR